MSTPVKTVYIGLDACDLDVARQFAREGDMPTLARLMQTGAVRETVGPVGYFVSGVWPSIYTGTLPSRHQFICGGEIKGGTYIPRWKEPLSEPIAIWDWASEAGRRVMVLDPGHSAARAVNGVMAVEWGCHDRHTGTSSYPPEFVRELDEKYGQYQMSQFKDDRPHYAPCDLAHRAGVHRTAEEHRALLTDLLKGHEQKAAVTKDLLRARDWDFFFTVIAETHCVGHQMWKLHDTSHPWHDPEHVRACGGDPLRIVYSRVDQSLGEILEAAGPDTLVYVHLSHGMRAHFDGTYILDPVLWQLDAYASGNDGRGKFTRATDTLTSITPRPLRRRALVAAMEARRRLQARTGPLAHAALPVPDWFGQRRWWAQPNDSVYASIRLNVEGREPNGRIAAKRKRDAELWLADRLYELINVETAEPAIANIYLTDEHYERVPGDSMGDLIVEWNRNAPIDTVWSPAAGVVSEPYRDWRTGDHDERGLLLATGPGVKPARPEGPISVVDVAPTLAAALGVDVPDYVQGVARAELLPEGIASQVPVVPPVVTPKVPARPSGSRRWRPDEYDVGGREWIEEYAIGLGRSLHAEHEKTTQLRTEVDRLNQVARIAEVTAWLRDIEVPETLRISVVMPTHNRSWVMARAVESVQRQTYGNWELLIVDDNSDDETPQLLDKLAANDSRIRVFRLEDTRGVANARNRGLDEAEGDVVVYLDDDNRMDPDWLRAVAWAFSEYPDVQVAYGARVIDDDIRHHGLPGRSLPTIQFNVWDRSIMLERNLVDMNVLAHRKSPLRFDPETAHFADWDLTLRLTDAADPLPLPVIAARYYSDAPDRMSLQLRDPLFERAGLDYVRQRAAERRS